MKLITTFLLQWIATSFGLWIAVRLLGETIDASDSQMVITTFMMAGLLLSAINIFIKPIVSIISLPITIMTLGLFTLVINGLMVYLALWWADGIEMSFFNSIITGIIIGIVNFIIGALLGALKSDE